MGPHYDHTSHSPYHSPLYYCEACRSVTDETLHSYYNTRVIVLRFLKFNSSFWHFIVSLTMLVTQTVQHIMSGCQLILKWKGCWRKEVIAWFIVSQHLPGETTWNFCHESQCPSPQSNCQPPKHMLELPPLQPTVLISQNHGKKCHRWWSREVLKACTIGPLLYSLWLQTGPQHSQLAKGITWLSLPTFLWTKWLDNWRELQRSMMEEKAH